VLYRPGPGIGLVALVCVVLALFKMEKKQKHIIGGTYVVTLMISLGMFINRGLGVRSHVNDLWGIINEFIIDEWFPNFINGGQGIIYYLLLLVRILLGLYCIFWLANEVEV
jgi:uncharacterized membrane protein